MPQTPINQPMCQQIRFLLEDFVRRLPEEELQGFCDRIISDIVEEKFRDAISFLRSESKKRTKGP